MAWPSGTISVTHLDEDSDSPLSARLAIKETADQVNVIRDNGQPALLAGSSVQVFSVANASANEHAVNRVTGDGRFAALAGLSTQLFSVANASANAHAVNRQTGDARFAAIADRSIGVGQVWTDVLASRAKSTTYTNNTGRPIMVSITVWLASGVSAQLLIGSQVVATEKPELPSGTASITLCGIVPDNTTYRLDEIGTITTVASWKELR